MTWDTKNLNKKFREKELGKKVIKKLERRRLSLKDEYKFCDICRKSFKQLQLHFDVKHKRIRKFENDEVHKIKCE